jgi:hypothetical protein
MNNIFNIEIITGPNAGSTVTLDLSRLTIRYHRDVNGNFIVNLHNQRIVVLPGAMRRIVGTDPRTAVGTWSITPQQAVDLGFVVVNTKREVIAI